MSRRKKLAERARPYLEPGEQIQAVFGAQSGLSPYFVQGYIFVLGLGVFIFPIPGDITTALSAVLLVTMPAAAMVALSIPLIVFSRPHQVVVTDRAILVLDVKRWTKRPTRLRLRHSRNFYFGQLSGLWGKFVLDNTKYWVPRQLRKDVAAADAALTQMTQYRQ